MQTAGVVLDFYDDLNGTILKRAFPSTEELPAIVKEAHILTSEERDVLRDEAFAIVLQNEGKQLRKFACVDAGNTLLSMLYFEENAQLLPEEAVKVAAANLQSFADDFGLETTPFIKAAAALVRTRNPERQPLVGDEADWSSRTNLISVRGGADSGRVIPAANQMKTAGLLNIYVVKGEGGQSMPQVRQAPARRGQVVDVSGKSPKPVFEKKSSTRYALGDRYPLDDYRDVEAAVRYFGDYYKEMDPGDAHEFAVKTAARADELGIPVTEELARYGSTQYAPDVEAHLASRRAHAPEEFLPAYAALKEKRSSVDPETFAQLLEHVDEESGLARLYGAELSDAYFSTFGGARNEKLAAAEWGWEGPNGETINGEQLSALAKNSGVLSQNFTPDIVQGFTQDPIGIFESMPATTKSIMARLAGGNEG